MSRIKDRLRSLRVAAAKVAFAWVVFLPAVAGALTCESRKSYSLEEGEVVQESLFIKAENVVIDGTVEGDVFLFAISARIRGEVQGNVYVFAKTLDITGTVDGSTHIFAQWARVEGSLARNFYGFAQQMQVLESASIGRDAFIFGDGISLEGRVNRDMAVLAGTLDIAGSVGRDVTTQSDRIALLSGATIAGDLDARVPRPDRLQISEAARVSGETSARLLPVEQEKDDSSRYASAPYYLWKLGCMIGAFVTALILRAFFPRLFQLPVLDQGQGAFAFGFGTVMLVGGPVLLLMLAATLIGAPPAIILALLYAVSVYFAKIFTAAWVGAKMLPARLQGRHRFVLSLLVGLALVYTTISLPYIGWLVHLACLGFGLGILILRLRKIRHGRMWPASTSSASFPAAS